MVVRISERVQLAEDMERWLVVVRCAREMVCVEVWLGGVVREEWYSCFGVENVLRNGMTVATVARPGCSRSPHIMYHTVRVNNTALHDRQQSRYTG